MTKLECIIEKYGFKRARSQDFCKHKHDGTLYEIRVWEAEINGEKWSVECENYYGTAVVFWGENRLGDYEYRYERFPFLFDRNSMRIVR